MAAERIVTDETDYERSVTTRANLLGVFFGEEYDGDLRTFAGVSSPQALLSHLPELKARLEKAAGKNKQYLTQALEQVVLPKGYHIGGNFERDELPSRDQPEEFALRTWPDDEKARAAFMIGLTWKHEEDQKWTDAYNAAVFAKTRARGAAWVNMMQADIDALLALPADARMAELEVRVASMCSRLASDREYYGDNGHW